METPLENLIRMRLGGETSSLPDDSSGMNQFPILWSFLTRRDVNGNLAKEPASISIRLGLGAWMVTLTDPSLEVSLTATTSVLADALEQLEQAAARPSAAWAPWKRSTGKFVKVNKNASTREEGDNGK